MAPSSRPRWIISFHFGSGQGAATHWRSAEQRCPIGWKSIGADGPYPVGGPLASGRGLAEGRAVVREVDVRNSEDLSDLQPRPAEPLSNAELFAAGDLLLRAVAGIELGGADLRYMRTVYCRWQEDNSVLAAHLSVDLPSFFAWLKGEP